mgnify:CR=1 FL=1
MRKEKSMSSTDIFAEMAADAVEVKNIPKDSQLSGIQNIVQRQIDLETQIAAQEQVLKNFKKQLADVQTQELPQAMDALGLATVTLNTGERIEIKPFVSASISKANKEEAYAWLRDHGHGDLIKVITKVDTGRDEKAAEKAQKALVKAGLAPSTEESVHSGTLKVWIREQVETGEPIPLELFCIFWAKINHYERLILWLRKTISLRLVADCQQSWQKRWHWMLVMALRT